MNDESAPPQPSRQDATDEIVASAEALGIELDRAEAERWIEAVSTESDGGDVMIDVDTGVYGHRVTMADLDPAGLDRFRRMMGVVGFPDDPPRVVTALALSGSAAQARVQRFPADADFFERIHITVDTRDEACQVLADLMRDKALTTMRGAGHRLQEVKLGSWPDDGVDAGGPVRRGTPVSWTPAQIEAGEIAYRSTDGADRVLSWDDAALDPGWCKLDWVIEDPVQRALVNASNMLDVTWEAPDGSITPLDGYLDTYFQEVYLETESIPLFSKLVKELSADSVAEYVETLTHEVWKYTVKDPNYGKAARRLYNVFRLTGRYTEAAYLRELFDEPVTALYQVAALLRTLDEAAGDEDAFDTEAMVAQYDALIISAISALEGRSEAEIVRRLLRLRDAFSNRSTSPEASTDLEDAQAEAMHEVDVYFKRALDRVPSIKAFLDDLAASPH